MKIGGSYLKIERECLLGLREGPWWTLGSGYGPTYVLVQAVWRLTVAGKCRLRAEIRLEPNSREPM